MGQGKAIGLKRLLLAATYEERVHLLIRYAHAHARWIKMTGRKRDGSKKRNRQRRKIVANEITASGSLAFSKSGVTSGSVGQTRTADQFSVTGSAYIGGTFLAATGGTVVPLGAVTGPHFAWLRNLDATNFVRFANGSGGAKLIKLRAGEWAIVPLDDGAVPYAFADTASVEVEYLIVQL